MEPGVKLDIILDPHLEVLIVLLDGVDLPHEITLDYALKLDALVGRLLEDVLLLLALLHKNVDLGVLFLVHDR